MTRADQAVETFEQGFNCSQAVLAAFAPSLGLDRTAALKLAAGFGGGMGTMGDACGAVTGALMALGLKFGHTAAGDKAGKQRIYALVRQFATQFKARHGSITCRDLLGFDIGTPEGMKQALERDTHHTVCPKFVRDAAEIVEGMLTASPSEPA
jgi:C_GCAxxG_C_C family probable redox protein